MKEWFAVLLVAHLAGASLPPPLKALASQVFTSTVNASFPTLKFPSETSVKVVVGRIVELCSQ